MAKLSVEMASENFNIKSLIILLIDKELDIQKGGPGSLSGFGCRESDGLTTFHCFSLVIN